MPSKGSTLVQIVDGKKRCGSCCTWKPVDDFHRASRERHGLQSSCKQCSKDVRSAHARAQRQRDPVMALLRAARQRADLKGIPFDLSKDDIAVPDRCPVLGIPLVAVGRRFGAQDASPSLDRIHNDAGYHADNIVVVSWRANRLKSDATPQELRRLFEFYSELEAARAA